MRMGGGTTASFLHSRWAGLVSHPWGIWLRRTDAGLAGIIPSPQCRAATDSGGLIPPSWWVPSCPQGRGRVLLGARVEEDWYTGWEPGESRCYQDWNWLLHSGRRSGPGWGWCSPTTCAIFTGPLEGGMGGCPVSCQPAVLSRAQASSGTGVPVQLQVVGWAGLE